MVARASIYLNGTECGNSEARMGGGGRGRTNALTDHAERKAWRDAWPTIRRRVLETGEGTAFEVIIEVNMTICADCQKWMIVEARRQLGQLGRPFTFYAEVPPNDRVPITRDSVWNVQVGQCRFWKVDQSDVRMGRVKKSDSIYQTAS